MEKHLLVLCDPDEHYAAMLAEYMNSQSEFAYRAEPFTDPERAAAYVQSEAGAVLLLHESLRNEHIQLITQAGLPTVYLSETETVGPYIRKYQSANNVMRQLLELCPPSQAGGKTQAGEKQQAERPAEVKRQEMRQADAGRQESSRPDAVRQEKKRTEEGRQEKNWSDAGRQEMSRPYAEEQTLIRSDARRQEMSRPYAEEQTLIRSDARRQEMSRSDAEEQTLIRSDVRQKEVSRAADRREEEPPTDAGDQGKRQADKGKHEEHREKKTEETRKLTKESTAEVPGQSGSQASIGSLTENQADAPVHVASKQDQSRTGDTPGFPAPESRQSGVAEQVRWDVPETKLIAVYSPVGRCGKTSFAITLGEMLAFHAHILYLNMEDYSGFSSLVGRNGQGDLTDLLYYARTDSKGALQDKTAGLVQKFERLMYIPPAFNAGDLRSQSVEQWCDFLSRLAREGTYNGIILDVGTQIEEVYRVLDLCSRIYVPVLEDPSSKAKLRQFREEVSVLGSLALQEKVRYLQLPVPGKEERLERLGFPERIVRGRMGDYVKKLLRSDERKYLPV